MDEPPPASPLGDDHTGYPIIPVRSPGRRWARLLVIALVFVTPLAYIVSQQSPELLPRVVVALIPPTVTPTATATPVPLVSILRARPLRLPTLPSGSACSATSSHFIDIANGDAVGDGPVYLYSAHSSVFSRPVQSSSAQWGLAGQLWFLIKPGVQGEVLVRGHQVDGPHEVRFGAGDPPAMELIFTAPAQAHPGDISNPWTIEFADVRLPGAGCYAIQIDSETATSVIIFHAEPQQG